MHDNYSTSWDESSTMTVHTAMTPNATEQLETRTQTSSSYPYAPNWPESTETNAETNASSSAGVNEWRFSEPVLEMVLDYMGYFNLCLACSSMVLCIMSAIIHSKQTANRSALYLVALNIGDGVHSLGKTLPFFLLHLTLSSREILFVAYYLGAVVATCFRRTAICMNALTSLDRFLAIAFPLRDRTRFCGGGGGRRGGVGVVVSVFLAVVALHGYMLTEYRVDEVNGVWMFLPTAIKRDYPDVLEAFRNVARVACFYCPLFSSLALNMALLVSLRLHDIGMKAMRSQGGHLASTQSPDKVFTIMRRNAEHVVTSGESNDDERIDDAKTNAEHVITYGESNNDVQKYNPGTEAAEESVSASREGGEDRTGKASEDDIRQTRRGHPSKKKKKKVKADKQKTDSAESERTKLILIMTFSFFFLALPRTSVAIAMTLNPEFNGFGALRYLYFLLSDFCDGLVFSTDIVLFVVSYVYSAQFRKHVKGFMKSLIPSKSPPSTGRRATSYITQTAITST